ncbi:Uncharacterised protein [Vibrio cholerae]|nr:Uncharacterised protein [Vibrio cholerae]CSB89087.1 Uncharacterised protein [Vibrio cholerae]CSC30191.1 Uncharacterised protein [Vibrio cholerae]
MGVVIQQLHIVGKILIALAVKITIDRVVALKILEELGKRRFILQS